MLMLGNEVPEYHVRLKYVMVYSHTNLVCMKLL